MSLDVAIVRLRDALERLCREHAPVALASSLGAEDMVLTDLIARRLPAQIDLFTLDTGRLPQQTHELIDRVRERYGLALRVHLPERARLEDFLNKHGSNPFYRSVALRRECCAIRKVEPLQRALHGYGAWLTGLRREQSVTRKALAELTWDEENGLYKASPLLEWSEAEVWEYLRRFEVPYNSLHDQHYPSIGCAPCSRAVAAGEELRAGRWWWEQTESKECGLHRATAG